MKLVWRARRTIGSSIASTPHHSATPSTTASDVQLTAKDRQLAIDAAVAEATTAAAALVERDSPKAEVASSSRWFSWKLSGKKAPSRSDPEKQSSEARPMRMFAPVYGGLGAALAVCKPIHIAWLRARLIALQFSSVTVSPLPSPNGDSTTTTSVLPSYVRHRCSSVFPSYAPILVL